ncbi:MAG: family 10 glycosylhydrolase [Candidatus Omnitrophota bacterium]
MKNTERATIIRSRAPKLIGTALLCAALSSGVSGSALSEGSHPGLAPAKGVWLTCFSKKRVLFSDTAAREFIAFCSKADIKEVYLQLYRADKAYYDSSITDRSEYDKMAAAFGSDPIFFLAKEADRKGIKVYAWINVLCVAKNETSTVLKKFGKSVLTMDQRQRPSMRGEKTDRSDRFYLRDEQIFLEPGDPRVVEYAVSIVDEVLKRYPMLNGVHLDYIRYPHPVPYIPDSRFLTHGISYGYGKKNVERFSAKTGLDPLTMKFSPANALLWDNWKRDQVTALVTAISKRVRERSSRYEVSCAVLPSPERAYLAAYQDWPLWLSRGIVDSVVLMNYTIDNRLAGEILRSALAHRGKGAVLAGMGVFLVKDPAAFAEQYEVFAGTDPDGIVFFSYDELAAMGDPAVEMITGGLRDE